MPAEIDTKYIKLYSKTIKESNKGCLLQQVRSLNAGSINRPIYKGLFYQKIGLLIHYQTTKF